MPDLATCPNPFCDGRGNIDVSVKADGRSRTYGTCKVSPHPEPNPFGCEQEQERPKAEPHA